VLAEGRQVAGFASAAPGDAPATCRLLAVADLDAKGRTRRP
jgi:hypothetical protein